MRTTIVAILTVGLAISGMSYAGVNIVKQANKTLLPSPFPVYTDGTVVLNHPYPGLKQTLLPTVNDNRSVPGCYIACYTHDKTHAVYAVSNDIYVVGQIRVPGQYVNRICIPKGYEGKDIASADILKKLCVTTFPACKDCWAGGDTGGWFGIQ